MTKTNQDVSLIPEGDNRTIRSLVTEDGSPKDVSNFDVQFTLAPYAGDAPSFQYTDADSNVSITDHDSDGTPNAVDVELLGTDTAGLGGNADEGQNYYYEIELTDTMGDTQTVTTGTIPIAESY